ncbi:MAG: DUF2798 domain-containing protein [Gammaproteobacteria bacterium]
MRFKILFSLFMSGGMAAAMSAFFTWLNLPTEISFLAAWPLVFLKAWMMAFPISLLWSPIAAWLTKKILA